MRSYKISIIFIITIILICICSLCIGFGNNGKEKSDFEYIIFKKVLDPYNGYTNESGSNYTEIEINQSNITNINFILEWKDFSIGEDEIVYGDLDDFELEVTPPDNKTFKLDKKLLKNKENRTGTIFIEFQINEISNHDLTIVTNGIGIWRIRITCLNATGYELSCGCPSAVRIKDPGNAWKLMTTIYYYEKL